MQTNPLPPLSSTARALHLLGLWSLAVSQPLLGLLAPHPPFFISHQSASAEIVAFALLVCLGPPLVFWIALELLRAASRPVGDGLFAAGACLLAAALVWQLMDAALPLPPALSLALAAAAAAGGAVVFGRSRGWRALASALGVAPIAVLGLFLARSPIAELVFHDANPVEVAADSGAALPLVLVVFDELPTTSLQRVDGSLDAERFPAFARLAATSTWFRNASSVHTSTAHAVPAILTGRAPDGRRYPTLADHPRNLFSLLEGSHAIHAVETETMLFRGSDPNAAGARAAQGSALPRLLSDAGWLYLHLLLPDAWAESLPSVSRSWKNFAAPEREVDFASRARETIWRDFDEPKARFERFTASIEACDAPCFYFIHSMLPHLPWRYLPSGRRYTPDTTHGFAQKERWSDDDWAVAEGYQQHMLQLGLADRLLAELIAKLEQAGLWSRAVVVVTADHGIGFWPGASARRLADNPHPEDLLRVPLFVKSSGQRDGRLDDRPARTLDVLPTVAALLQIEVPEAVDGCSLLDADCASGGRIRVWSQSHVPQWIDAERLRSTESLQRRQRLFGAADAARPFALRVPESAAAWIGQPVDANAVTRASELQLHLTRLPIDHARNDPAVRSLARISGQLRGPTQGSAPLIAVAVDGRIEAVVPARPQSGSVLRFSAFVPERAVEAGRHELAFYRLRPEDPAAPLALLHRELVVLPQALGEGDPRGE